MVSYSLIGAVFGDCVCAGSFDCTSGIDANGGLIIWVLLTLYMFKALGTVCDEYFVPSLEMISEALQLSNDVAGATFMAAGSSAPELFTSLVATFLIVNEGGVGAIIGSAIFNILVIVGATALCAGQELVIWWYPLARDCFFYLVAIILLAVSLMDDVVTWYEGFVMFVMYAVYCIYMKFNSKVARLLEGETRVDCEEDCEGGDETQKDGRDVQNGDSVVPTAHSTDGDKPQLKSQGTSKLTRQSTRGDEVVGASQPGHVVRSMKELGRQKTMERLAENQRSSSKEKGAEDSKETNDGKEDEADGEEEEEALTGWRWWARDPLIILWELTMPSPEYYWLLFGASIANIAGCTYIMVDGVNRSGCNLGIGPLVMGLIFLAAGTSVPDALGSIAVAKQGEGDMAVANALGSNVFDILLGLGVPWMLSALMGNEVHFPGASTELMEWIGILVGVLVLFIGVLIINRWKLNKVIGAVLMSFYGVHVTVALVRVYA